MEIFVKRPVRKGRLVVINGAENPNIAFVLNSRNGPGQVRPGTTSAFDIKGDKAELSLKRTGGKVATFVLDSIKVGEQVSVEM